MKNGRRRFLLLHVGIVSIGLLFPLYRWLLSRLPSTLVGCLMHDVFFLYCPLCGGTRAIAALLRLDFFAALRYNAFVTAVCLAALAVDVAAWICFFRRRFFRPQLPRWVPIMGILAFFGYWILRNWLMIAYGIDPTGDLGAFWAAVRGG